MDNYFWFSVLIAMNSLLILILAMNVSRLRIKYKISLGDGGNKRLMAAIRTHCNGVEQLPIFAMVILVLTLLGASTSILSILVIGFTLARLCHAYGMLYRIFIARRLGAGFTYIFQMIAALTVCVHLLT
ncbi:MAPEG family protein [Colwellia piezophila]|uniref:MAPEG family protein n=1 Tax=Colwellia piezophila TaxID=211668 RepID=UPI000373DCBF|nr:MAPEG family protein [Colwellia piezophila]